MKKDNRNAELRKDIYANLVGLGIEPKSILSFFNFLSGWLKESNALIEGIEGGVKDLGSGSRSDCTIENEIALIARGYDQVSIVSRYDVTNHHRVIASLFIPLEYMVDHCQIYRDIDGIKPDPSNLKLQKTLYVLFLECYFHPDIFGWDRSAMRMRQVVRHWREILDMHRVNLKLANLATSDELMQADRFLKILERGGSTAPVKKTRKTKKA